MLLIASNALEAAEPCLLNAQAAAPADPRWPHLLGELYRRLGRLELAASWFERDLRLDARDLSTRIALGDVDLSLGALDAAEATFRDALTSHRDNAAALAGLGRTALARQDAATAVQFFERALEAAPQASGLHHPLAMAYRDLGNPAAAEAHLRVRGDALPQVADPILEELDALLLSPMSYETKGREALTRGDWTAAAGYFRHGIALAGANAPMLGVLHQQLGSVLFQLGDPDGARVEFEQAVRWAPESAKARYSLGVLMESIGRHQEALDQLTAAVRDDPSYVEARLQLAAALQRSGRTVDAERQYQDAVRIDPRVALAK
jgi:tetratricopeptide (TPR) repeat protein